MLYHAFVCARMKEMAKMSAPSIAISRRLDRRELLLSMVCHSASYFRRYELADIRLKLVQADNEQKLTSPDIPRSIHGRNRSDVRESRNLHCANPGDGIETFGSVPNSSDCDASENMDFFYV